VSTLAGLVVVTLSDSGVLPLRLMNSAQLLQTNVHRLLRMFSQLVPNDTAGQSTFGSSLMTPLVGPSLARP